MTLVSSRYMRDSADRDDAPAARTASRWDQQFRTGRARQQQFLERGLGCGMQPAPFANRHQHGRFGTSLGHDLRTVRQAGIEEFTETRFGVLNRPGFHGSL